MFSDRENLKLENISVRHWMIWFVLKYLQFPTAYTDICHFLQARYKRKRTFLKLILCGFEFMAIRFILQVAASCFHQKALSKYDLLYSNFVSHHKGQQYTSISFIVLGAYVIYMAYKLYGDQKANIYIWRPTFDLMIRNIDHLILSFPNYYRYKPVIREDFPLQITVYKTKIYYSIHETTFKPLYQFAMLVLYSVHNFENVRFVQRLRYYPLAFSRIRVKIISTWLSIELIYSLVLAIISMFY